VPHDTKLTVQPIVVIQARVAPVRAVQARCWSVFSCAAQSCAIWRLRNLLDTTAVIRFTAQQGSCRNWVGLQPG